MNDLFVMLVDDEISFLETVTKRLDKRDIRVITSTSGEEALETLNRNRNLDVVILDVKMPGMDGIEALKEIKKDYPLTEVIMLTGDNERTAQAIDRLEQISTTVLMPPSVLSRYWWAYWKISGWWAR